MQNKPKCRYNGAVIRTKMVKDFFLILLFSLGLSGFCTSAFSYDILKDPENRLLSEPADNAAYAFDYDPQTDTTTIKLLGRNASARWIFRNTALLDFRQTSQLKFQIKANFPVTIIPRVGNARQEFSTFNFPPVTSYRGHVDYDDGRWSGYYFPLTEGAWLDYAFDIFGAVSQETPLYYEMGWLQLDIQSGRVGNNFQNQVLEIKGLSIEPPNAACRLNRNHAFFAEGAEGPSVPQVIANLSQYRFFDCTDSAAMPAAAVNNGKKYVLFYKWPGEMDKIFPGTIPKEEELSAGEKLQRGAAPGEYRNFSFAIRSKSAPVNKINAEATDLTAKEDDYKKIGAENIQLWKARYLYQKYQRDPQSREISYTLKPIYLEPLQDDTLRPNVTRGLWVTVHVPADTAPGRYEGALKVNVDGDKAEIPIAIEVWPFQLAEPKKPFGILFTAVKAMEFKELVRDNNGQGNILEDNLVLRWLKDIREHGLNAAFVMGGIPIQDPNERRIKKFILQTDLFSKNLGIMDDAQMLDQYEKAGFSKNIPFFFSPYGSRYDVFGPSFAAQLKPGVDMLRSRGWNQIIARQFDEPNNNFRARIAGYTLSNIKKSFQTLRNAGLDTLAESDPIFQTVIGKGADGKPLISVMGGYVNFMSPDGIAKQKELGGKVMPTVQFLGRETPLAADRGLKGVWIWRNQFDGFYGYSYYEPMNESLNPFDDIIQPDYGVIAMKGGKILPTLMWEIDREAINDYRYLLTLEQWIAKDPEAPWAKEAQQYLDTLKEKFSEFAADYSIKPLADADFEKMRADIAGFTAKAIATSVSPEEAKPLEPPATPQGSAATGGGCGCTVCQIRR